MNNIQHTAAASQGPKTGTNQQTESKNKEPETVDSLLKEINSIYKNSNYSKHLHDQKINNKKLKLYKLIGLDSENKAKDFTVQDDSLSINPDCPTEQLSIFKAVMCAKKLANQPSNQSTQIDIKHIVFNGRILDIMDTDGDFKHLDRYLKNLSSENTDAAKRKIDAIISCRNQVNSLEGQFKTEVLGRLDASAGECVADPARFFVTDKVASLAFLKALNRENKIQELSESVSRLDHELRRDESSLIMKAIHNVHPLDKMTTGTAIMLAGFAFFVAGVSNLTTSSSKRDCYCTCNNSLANKTVCDLQFTDSSLNTRWSIFTIIAGLIIGFFPIVKVTYNFWCEKKGD